jgi:thermostable 8-oxoguanine DNA glycosylase
MPSEVGIAAFKAVKRAGLLEGAPTEGDVESVLSRPLVLNGRSVHYRFCRPRSRYLSAAIRDLRRLDIQDKPHTEFRDLLTTIDGIGLKTASWITRNWLDSDEVAVLDVHVLRAGEIIGLFDPQASISRDYRILERRFLAFAAAISVRASRLDALIWRQMKSSGTIGLRIHLLTLQP